MNHLIFLFSVFAVVAISYIALIRLALKSGREIDSVEVYFFGRNLSAAQVFGTLYAAEMSIATVYIAFFDLAPILGFKLIAAIFTFCLGQIILIILLPRIRSVAIQGAPLPSAISKAYDSGVVRRAAAAALTLSFAGLFATEIIVGAQLLQFISANLDLYTGGVFLISVIVVAYTVVGGYRNVIVIDKIQTIALLLVVSVMALIAYLNSGRIGFVFPSESSAYIPPAAFVLNLLVINAAYPIVDMAAWHRISAAKSTSEGRKGFALGIVVFMITWTTLLLSALIMTQATGKSGAQALVGSFELLASGGPVLAILAGATLGALIAALLSTGDAFLICAAQAVYYEIDPNSERTANEVPGMGLAREQVAQLAKARKIVLSLAVVSMLLIALLRGMGANVADLVFIVYGSTTALLPSVLFLLFFPVEVTKRFALPALLSIVIGVCVGWLYGFLSLAESVSAKGIAATIDLVTGVASPYNAATTALAWSIVVFGVTSVYSCLIKVWSNRDKR